MRHDHGRFGTSAIGRWSQARSPSVPPSGRTTTTSSAPASRPGRLRRSSAGSTVNPTRNQSKVGRPTRRPAARVHRAMRCVRHSRPESGHAAPSMLSPARDEAAELLWPGRRTMRTARARVCVMTTTSAAMDSTSAKTPPGRGGSECSSVARRAARSGFSRASRALARSRTSARKRRPSGKMTTAVVESTVSPIARTMAMASGPLSRGMNTDPVLA